MLDETPLVIFTIIAQMSAGSFVVLGLIHLLGIRVAPTTMDRVSDPALYAIGPLLALGFLASVFHLGRWLRAANALRHLDSSWLSREIAVGMVFAGLGAAFALCQWRKWLPARARQALAILTAAVGMALVYVIGRVYSLRTIVAWDTWHTTVTFYLTSLLLGALAVGVVLVVASAARGRRGSDDTASQRLILNSVRGIAIGSILMIGLQFVNMLSSLGELASSEDPAARASINTLVNTDGGFAIVQAVLGFVALTILALFLVRLSLGAIAQRGLVTVAATALSAALASEVIGRMLFYASGTRVGM
ncbi:MAG: DmsC/YnfH family molybdoenzyme membrane anchor subunit [Nocardioidaceae bacterium]